LDYGRGAGWNRDDCSGLDCVGSGFDCIGAAGQEPLLVHSSDGEDVFRQVERFYEAYDYFVCNKRTFVEVKSALTLEGAIAARDSQGKVSPVRITNDGANCWNHELRAMSDAVLVSSRTLLADNPGLDVRLAAGNNPMKVVLACHHEFTADEVATLKAFNAPASEIFSPSVIVFSFVPQPYLRNLAHSLSKSFESTAPADSASSQNNVLEVVQLPSENFRENWEFVLAELSGRGMHRLMVEPGANLALRIFESGLWNRLDIWRSQNPHLDELLDGISLDYPELPDNIVAGESAMLGNDILTVYYQQA